MMYSEIINYNNKEYKIEADITKKTTYINIATGESDYVDVYVFRTYRKELAFFGLTTKWREIFEQYVGIKGQFYEFVYNSKKGLLNKLKEESK